MNCLLSMWQFCDLELTVHRFTRFSEYHYKAGSNGFGTRVKTESHKGDIICPHCASYLLCTTRQSVPKHHPWHESHTGSKRHSRQGELHGSVLLLSSHLCGDTSLDVCRESRSNLPVGLGKVTGDKSQALSVLGPLLCHSRAVERATVTEISFDGTEFWLMEQKITQTSVESDKGQLQKLPTVTF